MKNITSSKKWFFSHQWWREEYNLHCTSLALICMLKLSVNLFIAVRTLGNALLCALPCCMQLQYSGCSLTDANYKTQKRIFYWILFSFFFPSFSRPRTDGRRLTLAWADSHNSGPNISLSNTPRLSSSHRFNPFLATLSWPIPYLLLTQGPALGRYGCQLWRRLILR